MLSVLFCQHSYKAFYSVRLPLNVVLRGFGSHSGFMATKYNRDVACRIPSMGIDTQLCKIFKFLLP